MEAKGFSLRECYILACYGLRASLRAGKLEGFSKEEEKDEIQEDASEGMQDVREGI